MGFVQGESTVGAVAAEFVACGEKTFACVAFTEERFVLGAEKVPERVEGFVVGTVDDVA